jgi:hypothetical protein
MTPSELALQIARSMRDATGEAPDTHLVLYEACRRLLELQAMFKEMAGSMESRMSVSAGNTRADATSRSGGENRNTHNLGNPHTVEGSTARSCRLTLVEIDE